MRKNISVKNIFILLGIILGSLIVVFFVLSFVITSIIFIGDAKENREKAERFYTEDIEKYKDSGRPSFAIKYTYSMEKNLGWRIYWRYRLLGKIH